MTGDQVEQRPKRKRKSKAAPVVEIELAEAFDPATAKDKDFDLDLDAAKFQGKKGQAGSRTKSPDAPITGGPDPRADGSH